MGLLSFSEITDKIDGLEESNILVAALEFRIFTHLGTQVRTAEYVSRKAKLTFEGTVALLDALCAMSVLIKTKGKYKNSAETYKHLCEASKDYKNGTVFLKKETRDEWSDLINVIQRGRKEDEGGDDPAFRELFTHAMHERSEKYSKKLAKIVARKAVGNLIDVGGGPGSYSSEILRIDKKANALLIDRVASLKVAKKILRKLSVYKRFKFCPGDIFDTDFGVESDTVLYSNILHIYNESENFSLLNKIHASLKLGGRIIIVDLFLNTNRTQPFDAALFSLTMLMFTDTGRTYSFKETETLLTKIGFGKFKRFDLGRGSSVIEAEKV
jgi:hypothetical protein